MPTDEDFIRTGAAAAPWWGLRPTSIDVLSHSENVVLRLELAGGDQKAMRLHRPGYNTIDELDSEVRWVASLARAGVPVPSAMPTLDGRYYRTAEVVGPDGAERREVGVVDWIDGEPLGGPVGDSDPSVVARFGTIGELAARIRDHSSAWTPPPSFVRRRWDADGLMGRDPLWGRFWEAEPLTDEQRQLFAETRAVLHAELTSLSTGPDRFGLIHADLHLGNLMAAGPSLTVIDFDDAGFGWFASELAIALHPGLGEPWFDDARTALIEGYRSVFPIDDEEVELIDTFLTVRALMIVGWLDARPEVPVREFFPILADAAEEACRSYLA